MFDMGSTLMKFVEKNKPFAIGKVFNYYFLIAMYSDFLALGIRCSQKTYKGVVTKDLSQKDIELFKILYKDKFTIVLNKDLFKVYELKNKSFKEYFKEVRKKAEEIEQEELEKQLKLKINN